MSCCILAIDPGITGALAFLYSDHLDRVATYDMPAIESEVSAAALRDRIQMYEPEIAFIERVGPMPRDGVRQAWRFGSAYTTARVVVALLNIPTILITPAVWKKAMRVNGGADGKNQCRAMATRLFPSCAASFARKKDAGRAEAALLAYYGNQINIEGRR